MKKVLKQLESQELPQENINPRLANFYLRKWYKLQENINHLNVLEHIEAKILYSALAELDSDKRDLLGAKYFTPHRKVNGISRLITDKEVAEQLNMSHKDYVAKRQRFESELNLLLNKHQSRFKEEREKAIINIHGR